MRRRLTAVLAAISVFAMAGTALAVTLDPELFTEGYSDTTHVLVWGASDTEDLCEHLTGTYTFVANPEGTVTSLVGTTSIPYVATEDCALNAISVEGPNGQVNHGMVVSSFRRSLREAGIRGGGCMMRIIAQTSYGKGDQQVPPTVAPTTPTTALAGIAILTSHDITCRHGKPETAGQNQASSNSHGGGKPSWAGQGHGPNG